MLFNFPLVTAALALASSLTATFAAPLEIRAPPPPLVSHLNGPATFYRAVHHGEEFTNVKSIYVVGQSPKPRTSGTPIPGDLGLGALYVYADKMETYNHGNGWCKARLNPPNPNVWYLITFQYTPSPLVSLQRIMARLDVSLRLISSHSAPSVLRCIHARRRHPPSHLLPRTPLLQAPFMSIQSQLASILAVPGVEAEMDKWRGKPRYAGHYRDIFDGAVTKSLPAPDGSLFFKNGVEDRQGPDGELRIGLTLGLDWFSYLRSQIAPSHSSCPISLSIANLPPHMRYRTANLMLVAIMPGPKEQPPDECQRFLRVLVNELLRLWEHGFTVVTPSSPLGRLVRIILICICCDKPAAHKVGGFGSHSHTFFCTRCWISQADKVKPEAFQQGGFRARTDREHRMAGFEYASLTTDAGREAFVKDKAARWSEFARLPYFDLVRMIVIDPMHNLLLGLVKTHFHHIWVQGKIVRKTKELPALHQFLEKFQLPSYAGRLPVFVGDSSGGSLTADQWMLFATVIGPIAIPQIWTDFLSDPQIADQQRKAAIKSRLDKKARDDQAKKEKAAAKRAAAAAAKAAKKQSNKRQRTDDNAPVTPTDPSAPPVAEADDDDNLVASCLHPDDPRNFLKLAWALRILMKREIADWEIDQAEELLSSYCTELLTLYGPDVIKPNHHYCIHTPDCVRDFGPLQEFWTFLFERLNKILKSYKTNNKNGGELETTFFREFHRTIATSRLVARSTVNDTLGLFKSATKAMFAASEDDRGTVQALAKELDEADTDIDVAYSLSPRYTESRLSNELYARVVRYLSARFPLARLRSLNDPDSSPGIIANTTYCLVNDQHKYALGHFRWLRPFSELGIDPASTIWGPFQRLGWSETLARRSSSHIYVVSVFTPSRFDSSACCFASD
ncbi:hypothetical protein NMY22_g6153 [Coprinellus aureogranulatus]|nr:hypothetical protein NMY22_g6153 [Coprinellus aureogranulatus]